MNLQQNCFTYFKQSIDCITLPERFTFPFYYQPHPLALLAAKELQNHLETQQHWQHNFGITNHNKEAIGKMFGVLVVENTDHEMGYLSAFSGKLADKNHQPGFVPPVFDMLEKDGFFLKQQVQINLINTKIERLESNPNILECENILKAESDNYALKVAEHRKKMIEGRKQRKLQRIAAESALDNDEFLQLKEQLSQDSIKQKNQLRDLNAYWNNRIEIATQNLNQLTSPINLLREQRKELSAALQKKLFEQYQFLNIKGHIKNLSDIFINTSQTIPPAGSGECAAPKLLQYAFKNNMKPIAMAEFWWGQSPKSEIKKTW